MSFSDYEQSRALGSPAELFEFRWGEGAEEALFFTSADHDLEVGGETYASLPIERDEFEEDGNPDDQAGMGVRLPRDCPLADLYRVQPLDRPMILKLRAVHLDDPARQVTHLWSGRVVDVGWEHPRLIVSGERIATSLNQPGLRMRFARQCQHTHFRRGCWLNRQQWRSECEVVAVSGVTLQLAFLDHGEEVDTESMPADWFLGGFLLLDGVARYLIASGAPSQAGVTVTLNRPLLEIEPEVVLQLFPGCDRLHRTCRDRFGNELNYGGYDYVPPKGPMDGSPIS